MVDSAPSNRSKKEPQPTPRHCRLTGLNHALTYSNLAPISWRSEKLRRSPCTGHQVHVSSHMIDRVQNWVGYPYQFGTHLRPGIAPPGLLCV